MLLAKERFSSLCGSDLPSLACLVRPWDSKLRPGRSAHKFTAGRQLRGKVHVIDIDQLRVTRYALDDRYVRAIGYDNPSSIGSHLNHSQALPVVMSSQANANRLHPAALPAHRRSG